MEIAVDTMEKLMYDENGNKICKPIVVSKQKVLMELKVVNLEDSTNITEFMKKLGYKRTFFGYEDNEILMEFER